MVSELPEQLLEQARFLLTLEPNQANLRRAVSSAYYALFHLLIRATVLKWNEPLHQPRIARSFDHERMKKVSGATIKSIGPDIDPGDSNSIEVITRTELAKVAQAFIILQPGTMQTTTSKNRPTLPTPWHRSTGPILPSVHGR